MKRILNALICGVVLLFLCSSNASSEEGQDTKEFNSLPYWITDTYSYAIQPVFVAFAHNLPYDKQRQVENATSEIAKQVSIYKSADLKYQYIDSDDYLNARYDNFNEYFNYFHNELEVDTIASNIKILESYETESGCFYLGYDPSLSSVSYDLAPNTLNGVPSWTGILDGNIPTLEGCFLGVNSYQFYPKRSLVELLESSYHLAFMQIIYQTDIKTEVATGVEHSDAGINDSGRIVYESNVTLNGLHVIGRYIDEENSRIYSFVAAPENTYTVKE